MFVLSTKSVWGAVQLRITTTDDSPSRGQLTELLTWLADREDPYRIDAVYRAPDPERLGTVPEALSVAAASGGAVTVLVSGILEWIRNGRDKSRRRVPLTIVVERADGSKISIATEVAQAWTKAELATQIESLAAQIQGADRAVEDSSGGGVHREAP